MTHKMMPLNPCPGVNISEEDMKELIILIRKVGWEIALLNTGNSADLVKGMIIGNKNYVEYILSELP